MNLDDLERQVLNIAPGNADLSVLDGPLGHVRKIIIGDAERNGKTIVVGRLPAFDADVPKLTHLHLWNTKGTRNLPSVARGLQVLDVRHSQDLLSVANLPTSSRTLVLESCSNLESLPPIALDYPELTELSLSDCTRIPVDWINRLIERAPKLRFINLSGCTQIERITPNLPSGLDRLELNRCPKLTGLAELPLSLRRLGLREATGLVQLPDSFQYHRELDYLDLAFTKKLRTLPKLGGTHTPDDPFGPKPRTLFLFGSGILAPPSSEHGKDASVNVAEDTRKYASEAELIGVGQVRRCKLLFLGNGSAGKTFLATHLHERFEDNSTQKGRYAHYRLGSTHGIQFLDLDKFKAAGPKTDFKVNLHFWDFGGQEIYHSTHRLFVSRGSVFIIVWRPEQDGKQPPPDELGYQDVWQSSRYWLDYIRAECPHTDPLIAIVCADHEGHWKSGRDSDQANAIAKQQLRHRLAQQIGSEHNDALGDGFFVVDSRNGIGEVESLDRWIRERVGEVVIAEGTFVPLYWQIAQDMVEKWLPDLYSEANEGSTSTPEKSRLTIEQFAAELTESTDQTLRLKDERYDKLRAHWNDGGLYKELSDGRPWRIERTLRFLTHSGWLYWSADLFDSQVIVDQKWALEQAYQVLDRRSHARMYRKLSQNKGRFTLEQLQTWSWQGADWSEEDQRLLISFMESVGVCFKSSHGMSDGYAKAEYISPHHLPASDDLCRSFIASHSIPIQETVASRHLHRGSWARLMRSLCRQYGEQGTYTRDAVVIEGSTYPWNREEGRWSLLFQFVLDETDDQGHAKPPGLGGKVVITASGTEAGPRLGSAKAFVETFVPGYSGNASDSIAGFERDFCVPNQSIPTVFFSYALNPKPIPNATTSPQQEDYEEAVNAIYNALKPYEKQGRVKLLRDTVSIDEGERITKFMDHVGSREVSLVLVFTSIKYWKSWYCMYEFDAMIDSLKERDKSFQESVLVIEYPSGIQWTAAHQAPIENHWRNPVMIDSGGKSFPADFPTMFRQRKLSWDDLRDAFVEKIVRHVPTIASDTVGLRREWKKEHQEEIIQWVLRKLKLL